MSRLPSWLLKTASLLLSLLLVSVAMESGLRVLDYGNPDLRPDPFHGFEGSPPVFRERRVDGEGWRYVPRPNARDIERSFPVRKPDRGYRAFAFGGSTTRGLPYGERGSFAALLEAELKAAHPERSIEVINLGVTAIASTRVLRLMREAVAFEPDLFIVYTGHNEYVEARFHRRELQRSRVQARTLGWLLQSRFFYFLYRRYLDLRGWIFRPRIVSAGAERVASRLAEPFSEDTFASSDYFSVPDLRIEAARVRDRSLRGRILERLSRLRGRRPSEREEVEETFRSNLIQMIAIARKNDIDLVFLGKAENPKSRSVTTSAIVRVPARTRTLVDPEAWREHYTRGLEHLAAGRYGAAIVELEGARDRVPEARDPLLALYLGLAYQGAGRYERARDLYESRIRVARRALNEIQHEVADGYGVPVIPVQDLLREQAKNGIVGYENFFVDRVHMTLAGYQAVARRLATFLREAGLLEDGAATLFEAGGRRPALEGEPNGEGWLEDPKVLESLAWAEFNQGRPAPALELAERARALGSETWLLQLLLGYLNTKLGRLAEAQQVWELMGERYAARH